VSAVSATRPNQPAPPAQIRVGGCVAAGRRSRHRGGSAFRILTGAHGRGWSPSLPALGRQGGRLSGDDEVVDNEEAAWGGGDEAGSAFPGRAAFFTGEQGLRPPSPSPAPPARAARAASGADLAGIGGGSPHRGVPIPYSISISTAHKVPPSASCAVATSAMAFFDGTDFSDCSRGHNCRSLREGNGEDCWSSCSFAAGDAPHCCCIFICFADARRASARDSLKIV
jgi:hypothetical protein